MQAGRLKLDLNVQVLAKHPLTVSFRIELLLSRIHEPHICNVGIIERPPLKERVTRKLTQKLFEFTIKSTPKSYRGVNHPYNTRTPC